MFSNRDIPPVLFLILLICVIVVTLSQILVVHNRGKQTKITRNMLAVQKELREIDRNIESAVNRNIPAEDYQKYSLQLKIYQRKISNMIERASHLIKSNTPKTETEGLSLRSQTLINTQNTDKSHLDWNNNLNQRIHFIPGFTKNVNVTNKYFTKKTASAIDVNKTSVISDNQHSALHHCPEQPPNLINTINVNFIRMKNFTLHDVYRKHTDILRGGMWRPKHCTARHRVAIIIPFRDREHHLTVLLANLLPILKRQQLNFRIFVVEQFGDDTFNKGRIMNAAFKEALNQGDFGCFVFHDVDLIPEDDRNMYSCPVYPRHLSVAIDEMKYRLWYDLLVGGVLNMRTEHFQMVNGYSNMYWGWGAEDDDMAYRILQVGLKISRPPFTIARYKMIPHEKRAPTDWKKRARLLQTVRRRFRFDGLNSVEYKMLFIHEDPLFTHIMVDVGKPS